MERTKQEIINDFKNVVFPYVANRLKELNYENLGQSDYDEFLYEADILIDLAQKGLDAEKESLK